MKKNVLLLGGAGFIGKATLYCLESAGWKVTKGVRNRRAVEGELEIDLTDAARVLALRDQHHFDAIVHLAANVSWDGATDAEMFLPNVLSTGCLSFLAREWGAQLIFASTAIVCGDRTQRIDQHSPIAPENPYAKSKWLAEQLIVASSARHCILRIGGVFGPRGPSHLGLNRAIDGVIRGEAPTVIGLGSALRNYVYVKDVASMLTFALEKSILGVHLVAGSEILSIRSMLEEVCRVLSPSIKPSNQMGSEGANQIIVASSFLPAARKFSDALIDIKNSLP
jgi:nucleoside-diphosphate-sugar epimerase